MGLHYVIVRLFWYVHTAQCIPLITWCEWWPLCNVYTTCIIDKQCTQYILNLMIATSANLVTCDNCENVLVVSSSSHFFLSQSHTHVICKKGETVDCHFLQSSLIMFLYQILHWIANSWCISPFPPSRPFVPWSFNGVKNFSTGRSEYICHSTFTVRDQRSDQSIAFNLPRPT